MDTKVIILLFLLIYFLYNLQKGIITLKYLKKVDSKKSSFNKKTYTEKTVSQKWAKKVNPKS